VLDAHLKVFNVIPCDSIFTFNKLKELKQKTPMHISEPDKAREELNKVKGYIVLYPNLFLCNEYLKPSMLAKEKLLPSSLWT
jgi:phospholipase D1/2